LLVGGLGPGPPGPPLNPALTSHAYCMYVFDRKLLVLTFFTNMLGRRYVVAKLKIII